MNLAKRTSFQFYSTVDLNLTSWSQWINFVAPLSLRTGHRRSRCKLLIIAGGNITMVPKDSVKQYKVYIFKFINMVDGLHKINLGSGNAWTKDLYVSVLLGDQPLHVCTPSPLTKNLW